MAARPSARWPTLEGVFHASGAEVGVVVCDGEKGLVPVAEIFQLLEVAFASLKEEVGQQLGQPLLILADLAKRHHVIEQLQTSRSAT